MRIDGDSATVIRDADETVGLHLDFNPIGMAGERLVHGVVDDFGEQVMQRFLVGAADVHAGPTAYWLEPFQDLDVFGGIASFRARAARGCLRPRTRLAPGGCLPRLSGRGLGRPRWIKQIGLFRGLLLCRCLGHRTLQIMSRESVATHYATAAQKLTGSTCAASLKGRFKSGLAAAPGCSGRGATKRN